MHRIFFRRISRYVLLAVPLLLAQPGTHALHAAPLPDFGDPTEVYMSSRQEQKLGIQFMQMIRQTLPLIQDPLLVEYIQSLGNRVASGLMTPHVPFTFFLVQSSEINAFAGPGGYIGIHSGLFLTTRSEGELASVIAHEMVHVTQRHLAQAYKKASELSLPMTAAVITAIILGRENSQLSEAALASAAAGSVQYQLNFTRAHEQEADRIGLEILANAGFDPRDMPTFFERLQQASLTDQSQTFEFLRSHPLTPSRIADTRNRAEQYPRSTTARNDDTFRLMRARIEVLGNNDQASILNTYAKRLATSDTAANRYGYALALNRSGDNRRALEVLLPLEDQFSDHLAYLLALAEIQHGLGKLQDAQRTCRHALALYPHHPALALAYAGIMIEDDQAEDARLLLREQLRYSPDSIPVHNRLAQAQQITGHLAESHMTLAERDYILGDRNNAVRQLNTALELAPADNNPLKMKIRARLDEISSNKD